MGAVSPHTGNNLPVLISIDKKMLPPKSMKILWYLIHIDFYLLLRESITKKLQLFCKWSFQVMFFKDIYIKHHSECLFFVLNFFLDFLLCLLNLFCLFMFSTHFFDCFLLLLFFRFYYLGWNFIFHLLNFFGILLLYDRRDLSFICLLLFLFFHLRLRCWFGFSTF